MKREKSARITLVECIDVRVEGNGEFFRKSFYKGLNGLDKLDLGCLFILVFMRFLEGEWIRSNEKIAIERLSTLF